MLQVHLSQPADHGDNAAFAHAFRESMTAFHRIPAFVVRRTQAVEMQVIAGVLDAIRPIAGSRVPSGNDWMRFATAIGPKIYMPDGLTLKQWVEILTHELEHVSQFWRGEFPEGSVGERALPNGIGMMFLYLTQDIARVRYECRAYAAGAEALSVLREPLPSLHEVVAPLEGGYLLGKEAQTLASSIMDANLNSIDAGTLTTTAGRLSDEVLRELSLLYKIER